MVTEFHKKTEIRKQNATYNLEWISATEKADSVGR